MAAPPTPVVVQLPRPYQDEIELRQYAIRMKEIRLKALENDPGSFSSSLAIEIDQPMEFWTTRLTHPEARHFVVCLPEGDMSHAGDNIEILHSKWIGTLVLFGPRIIDPNTFMDNMSWKDFNDRSSKPTQMSLEGSSLMFYIPAVYVDSDYRRQGLGRSLSLETIKAIKVEMQKERAARAICMIGAEEKNAPALKLYEDLGWVRVADDRFIAKDGRKIVGVQMRLDIQS